MCLSVTGTQFQEDAGGDCSLRQVDRIHRGSATERTRKGGGGGQRRKAREQQLNLRRPITETVNIFYLRGNC